MQGIGVCFLVPLAILVPRKETAHQPSDSVSAAAIAAAGANTGLAATDVDVLGDGQMAVLDGLDEEAQEEADAAADLEQPLLISRRRLPANKLNHLGTSPERGSLDL